MTETPAPTDQNKEVFDRLLGRKGDASRLDPATNTVTRFFGDRMQSALEKAGFEAEPEISGHRQASVADAMKKHEAGAVCVVLGVKANNPSAFLICDYPAASIISEIMLGGDPEFASLSASRPPTQMERDLVRQFGDIAGTALQTTLSTPECPKALRLVEKTDDIRNGEEIEPVVIFDVTLTFGEAKPVLTLAVTHHMLLQMARPAHETVRKPEKGGVRSPNRNALTVKVPVTGSVALPPISLGELAALRTGDTLPLSAEAEMSVKLKVKDRPLYDCSLGRRGEKYALCLQRPHKAMTEALNGIGLPLPYSDTEEIYDE